MRGGMAGRQWPAETQEAIGQPLTRVLAAGDTAGARTPESGTGEAPSPGGPESGPWEVGGWITGLGLLLAEGGAVLRARRRPRA